jgi:signal transduction histidine kinase/ActR/RegA family two-component response regulator
MFFKKMKIGTRLTLGLSLIILFMLILICSGLAGMRKINDRLEHGLTLQNTKIWQANVIRDAAHTMDKAVLTIISTPEVQVRLFEKVKIITAGATIGNALEKLESLEQTSKGKTLLLEAKRLLSLGKKNNENIIEAVLNNRLKEAIDFYVVTQRPKAIQLHQICTELVTYEKEQIDQSYREAIHIYQRTRTAFLVIGLTATLCAILLIVFLTRSITSPLARGVRFVNRVTEGDYSPLEEEFSRDEAGVLLQALNHMVKKINEMKSLEQQLVQAQKLENVGRLAGGIAHDFNNLLTVIGGFSDLALRKVNGNESLKHNILEIQKASERAGNLTRQLLAFSRRQVLEMKIVDLNLLLKDLEKMLGRVIRENIEIKIIPAPDLGKVWVDPGQMEQVILNLVVNARDAMPSGGRLIIETTNAEVDEFFCQNHLGAVPGQYVRLTVSDTGIGMSAEIKEQAFEPFFTTKEKGKGTGLGLSTVYGIVKQSGGYIWVDSEEGCGTSFNIYFPRREGQADALTLTEETRALQLRNETILLVEDESLVRTLTSTILRGHGYQVYEASDGLEALQLVQKNKLKFIHLLLTDVIMPKMSGKELAERLISRHPDLRVLYTSGYTNEVIARHGILEDNTAFLQKPFTPKSLAQKVQEVLDQQE